MCRQGEFFKQSRGSSVDDHFLYSHDLTVCSMGDIERRNLMLVTLSDLRVNVVGETTQVYLVRACYLDISANSLS